MKKNQTVRNFAIFAVVTAAMPFLLCVTFAIFFPMAYEHLFDKMLPFAIAIFLFYVTANLLSFSDLKLNSNRSYSYFFNFITISFPIISFVIHSNIEMLDNAKILYEIKMGISNTLIALLVAEFSRRYLMKYENRNEPVQSTDNK